jgi:hypothetical protein
MPSASQNVPGFRSLPGSHVPTIHFELASKPPAQAQVSEDLWVGVADGADEARALVIVRQNKPEEIVFSLDEVYPDLSSAAETRMRALIDRICGSLVADLVDQAKTSLREAGY